MHNITPSALPKLSVIMVVRNAVGTVARALDSVIAQHYPNLEFIVWDGMSDDGTLDVIKRYSDAITLLKCERDESSPDGCNKAVPLATGDFIGFIYADDEFEPGLLWAVADAIIKNPGSDIISFGMLYHVLGKRGERVVAGYYAQEHQMELTLDKILSDLPAFVLSRFYKRGVFGPLNTDRSRWYLANDRELAARQCLAGYKNTIVPKALYGFTRQPQGISSNPAHYARIIEEHVMIADSLLARTDLSETQRRTVRKWKERQLAFGFWRTLAKLRFGKAIEFLRNGFQVAGGRFAIVSVVALAEKGIKRFGLMLSDGIDRGKV